MIFDGDIKRAGRVILHKTQILFLLRCEKCYGATALRFVVAELACTDAQTRNAPA